MAPSKSWLPDYEHYRIMRNGSYLDAARLRKTLDECFGKDSYRLEPYAGKMFWSIHYSGNALSDRDFETLKDRATTQKCNFADENEGSPKRTDEEPNRVFGRDSAVSGIRTSIDSDDYDEIDEWKEQLCWESI